MFGKAICNKNWHAAAHYSKSEVLNSLNKNASNEMSGYLHDKIRKHAIKQARRNHSVLPRSSGNFLSRTWFIYLALGACGIQESDVLKEQLQIVSQLHLQ